MYKQSQTQIKAARGNYIWWAQIVSSAPDSIAQGRLSFKLSIHRNTKEGHRYTIRKTHTLCARGTLT